MNIATRQAAQDRSSTRLPVTRFRSRRPMRRPLFLLRAAALPTAQGDDQAMPPQVLLTMGEAATVLRISHWTLYRLVQQRQLQTITIGRRRLVPLIAIQSFITNQSGREAV